MSRIINIRAVVWPFVLASLICCSACSGGRNAEVAWLVGSWELTHNPEHDDEDVLVFDDDGNVRIQTVDGRTLQGQYLLEGQQLKVVLKLSRNVVETSFDVNPEKTRLTYENGAYYTRNSSAEK